MGPWGLSIGPNIAREADHRNKFFLLKTESLPKLLQTGKVIMLCFIRN